MVSSTVMRGHCHRAGAGSDEGLDRAGVVGHDVETLLRSKRSARVRRQGRRNAGGLAHRVRELGRMGGAERDHRRMRILREVFPRDMDRDGGVRIEQIFAFAPGAGDLALRILLAGGAGVEFCANFAAKPTRECRRRRTDRDAPSARGSPPDRGRPHRTAAARNWTRPEYPSTAIASHERRAPHSVRFPASGRECRWNWWRRSVCRWAGPFAWPCSRRECRRNCRSAR